MNRKVSVAPMMDCTDRHERYFLRLISKNVLLYTEMIVSEAIDRGDKNKLLSFNLNEKPVALQLGGSSPKLLANAARIGEEFCYDEINLNLGCPSKKVEKNKFGACLIKEPKLVAECLNEMQSKTKLPVTVKTRLGWDENTIKIVEVAERLQDVGCKAISIHGRTRAQMYKGEADWTYIEKVKNNPRMQIPVFANGDINTPERALQIKNLGLDGAMIGRASIGNPWFFNEVKHFLKTKTHLKPATISERVEMAKRHLEMAIDWKGERLGIYETRRHYSNYFKGIPGIKPYRQKLVTSEDPQKVYSTLDQVLEVF